MSRPQRLMFPTEAIEASTIRMRRQLRRIRSQLERGAVTIEEARKLGEQVIHDVYEGLINGINEFVTGKGLDFGVTGMEPDMRRAMTDAVVRWNRIVDVLSGA